MRSRPAFAILLTIIAVLAGVVWPHSVSASTDTFKQQIVPLNCVFDTIDNGDGSVIHYLTPSECGLVVPPPDTQPELPTGIITDGSTPSSSGILLPGQPIDNHLISLFNNEQNWGQARTVQGVVTILKKGSAYHYSLSDPKGTQHTVTVLNITNHSVELVFASTPQYITLQLGQTASVDVNEDGVMDIRAKLEQITSPNNVKLHIWLLAQQPPQPTLQSASRNPVQTEAFIVVGASVGLLLLTIWVNRRIRTRT